MGLWQHDRHEERLRRLQVALCQLMPVNVSGVDQALELMVVSNAGDGGMGWSARQLNAKQRSTMRRLSAMQPA